mmetsp:Transcript_21398/g.85103  ORF Transcript_21398/g.85103 Transcript_21398/m.85103 type:complete len:325 (-) Transcript_21398:71-1045(-)
MRWKATASARTGGNAHAKKWSALASRRRSTRAASVARAARDRFSAILSRWGIESSARTMVRSQPASRVAHAAKACRSRTELVARTQWTTTAVAVGCSASRCCSARARTASRVLTGTCDSWSCAMCCARLRRTALLGGATSGCSASTFGSPSRQCKPMTIASSRESRARSSPTTCSVRVPVSSSTAMRRLARNAASGRKRPVALTAHHSIASIGVPHGNCASMRAAFVKSLGCASTWTLVETVSSMLPFWAGRHQTGFAGLTLLSSGMSMRKARPESAAAAKLPSRPRTRSARPPQAPRSCHPHRYTTVSVFAGSLWRTAGAHTS